MKKRIKLLEFHQVGANDFDLGKEEIVDKINEIIYTINKLLKARQK